ncbi:MAG: Excinuclease ABC subunit C [Candidatus Magasanikbacteria bacterium GW2011_GWC2_40_17]|uniref:Excinuclease ABC subunit C n=1 Tax=Candidatus Magasanikbacteria bacterium GW2011_GWA2_42_32 TaxID=1619039 RepID=A0A0G1A809_9BACT|nr:MAG: Excinuclease ABC subunit C [Candidatus Magasanikbacteria bacterium GW2011_GWC2_40_17]KKS57170.1 MAG: Excinuclease ABC subunit C [Candidatus Magasanikbacteria bacterium GW2011_GWA2_42_32]OGH85310.1 MAG: hypothetical protein A2294_00875 [Candidatus Magasanikbacteria bacterium RIFOXYB2_FULL_38_10]
MINLKNIPNSPGIYLFYNSQKELIYVGKATSLKNRVRSYFAGPQNPRPIEIMIHEVINIKWITTDSVLEAIILEGNYIKKYRPKYNIDWRDDKSWNYLVITREKFPKLLAVREHEIKQGAKVAESKYKYLFGPYPNLNTRATLKILQKIFFFSTCKPNQKRPCFNYQIGLCLGVCTGEITTKDYSHKVIAPLVLFLKGQKKSLLKKLTSAMKLAAKENNFEEASRLRDQIWNLQKIQDIALLNKDFVKEKEATQKKSVLIEGYDISNLGTTGKVGSLVVFNELGAIKSEYKKFNIKTVTGQNDVDCLKEILKRRLNHWEWPLPDLILVDGGKPQVNAAKQILNEEKINLPLVGIAKGKARKKNEFHFAAAKNSEEIIKWALQNKDLLIKVRDETHRFAIQFQKQKRKIPRG